MMAEITNVWSTMRAVNLFPEVILLSLGCYFIVKDKVGLDPKKATYIPLALAFVGQLAFAWPKDLQDVVMDFTMGLLNSFLAIGLYSFADKFGLLDKLGKRAGKVIDGGDNANTPAV